MPDSVTLEDIEAARGRIRDFVRLTPMLRAHALSQRLGIALSLKCENLQRTGSFKPRGAGNLLAAIPRPQGVIAASAGNHAQGVALAAARLGIPATVVMPTEASLGKRMATEGYGAEVVLHGNSLAAAIDYAQGLAQERSLLFISPFDNPYIVAGQGTLGLEVLEQEPEVDTVLVPTGGGGLLAGVAVAVKSLRPDVRVIGVQTRAMAGVVESLREGAPVAMLPSRTIADGVAVAGPSLLTLDLIKRYVDDVVAVSEEEVAHAVVTLIDRARLIVEGAGALGVAALLSGLVPSASAGSGRTVAVLSGGNIDINLLGRIVERGLLAEGRHRTLTVAAANVPGEMARISGVLASAGANILQVDHDRTRGELPIGVSRITFELEVAGNEAYERLFDALLASGLERGESTDLATPAAAQMPS
jgi:threonine dehydratase